MDVNHLHNRPAPNNRNRNTKRRRTNANNAAHDRVHKAMIAALLARWLARASEATKRKRNTSPNSRASAKKKR